METNEEAAPSPEANQSIEGREDGPKGEKKKPKNGKEPNDLAKAAEPLS